MRTGNRDRRLGWIAPLVLVTAVSCQSTPEPDPDWFDGGPLRPAGPETLQLTARVLAAKGETHRAGYVMNRMLADYPDFVGTYSEGAEVLVIEGRISEAVKWLDRGLARFPDHPVLMNDRGMCHLLLADLPAAKSDFEVAYKADTDDAEYVANLALANALSGNDETAISLWSRVVPLEDAKANLAIAQQARPKFTK
ncbi:MAG: hypothetical protein EBQ99_09440 [Planctomycetes bacterium]|nr:hypothetical protein [Planctomycetota bacterium]